jgi:hypothetical protein
MTTNNTYNAQSLDDDDLLFSNMSSSITLSDTMWGTNGSVITTGTSGLSWNDFGNSNTISIGAHSKALTVKGDAEFENDISIKGIKLMETLEKIEQRLNILRVDPVLEERWEKLRELGDAYRALEAECIDKDHIIDLLKK